MVMTDPRGRGDFHGDIEAVRRANRENPHRKIHDGRPAVRARAASVDSASVGSAS
jgi:hypothetical protein